MQASTVEFAETLDGAHAQGVLRRVATALDSGAESIVFDLATVRRFDSAGIGAVLLGLRQAKARGVDVRMQGLSGDLQDFFSLVSVERLTRPGARTTQAEDFVSQIGGHFVPLLQATRGLLRTGAETADALVLGPFRGRRWRLDRIAIEVQSAFFGALPVVLLISFLLGMILAMQAHQQMQVFGAEIYVADMVGVSVVYEIGPLMTGIVLAARSGSSHAAQLGAMVVAEEIDALRQMGIRPITYLVLPKVVALAFAVMGLGLVFDCVAVTGGAAFGYLSAGIAPRAYLERTADALVLGSFLIAVAKCVVFGAVVGTVGCGLGLRVRGGSEEVARATTNAVVFSIFSIIVLDAVFVTAEQVCAR